MKIVVFCALTLLACLAASLFGALHNQVSYTVGPEYFTAVKFLQFQIAPALPHRIGAALVGVYASWWMGLFMAAPIFGVGLFIPGASAFWRAGLVAIFIVLVITALGAATGLGLAILAGAPEPWMSALSLTDPVGFARAGDMHNASYLAGGIGLLVALAYMVYRVLKSRRGRRETAP